MLICKSLEYERKLDCENDINSTLIIRIRRINKKWTNVIGAYRQWQGTSATCNYNGKDRSSSLLRFKDMIRVFEKAMSLPGQKLFGGDLNIDRLPENNPIDRQDLKLLIPELMNFQESWKVTQINTKPTRHRLGQRSSLID